MNQAPQLRIRGTKDIIDALRSQDPVIRLSMLRAVIRDPGKAAAYGAADGHDLVDELCSQARSLVHSPLRLLVLGALAPYRDPRVREVFRREIHTSQSGETLIMAARYLSMEAEDEERPALSPLLLQDHSDSHARAAAEVMAGWKRLSVHERIRVAVLRPEGCTPPVLDESTEQAWSSELKGPYGSRARRLIEAQGEETFVYLRKRWTCLGDEDKTWLLSWGACRHRAMTVELILQGLDSGSDVLVLDSLEAIPRMGETGRMFEPHTVRHLKNTNPAVRLAAARAGAAGVDWEAALAAEEDTAVRMEMLSRLAEEKGVSAAPALIRLMEDGDYRLRATAVSALKRVGKEVAVFMKPLMEHPQQAMQVAAAQVLMSAGEDLWLEEKLLS